MGLFDKAPLGELCRKAKERFMETLDFSTLISSTLSHVIHGYVAAVAVCAVLAFVAKACTAEFGLFTSSYRKGRRFR
jgi:hypothetical protein